MPKLEITDVQIDNYNDTVDKFNQFDSGLNIICGANEIGKSTLMSFIKNIFTREKSDAKGYIKCNLDGKDIKLFANKNKLKENEPYLEKITSHSFKTGFIINLDDLVKAKKSDSEELINTIKDSSGNAVNIKETEYKDYIYGKKQDFTLTGTNKASKPFEQQFENLKELDNKIKELQSKEEEYNCVCKNLENIETEIKELEAQYECSNILFNKTKLKKEIETIKINEKLLENKQKLEAIRETYGAYNTLSKNSENIKNKLQEYKTIYTEKFEELNRIEQFDDEKLENFEINQENLKIAKTLADKDNSLKNEQAHVQKELQSHKDKIDEYDFELKNIQDNLNALGITNFDDYTNDKLLIENHLANYCKLSDDMRKNGESMNKNKNFDYSLFFMLLFGGIILACIGSLILHFHESIRYMLIALILVSISGINTAVMQKLEKKSGINNSYLKSLQNSKIAITTLSKRNKLGECSDENFVVDANCNLDKMKEQISEYKLITNEKTKIETNKKKEESEITKCNEKLSEINKEVENINKNITEFLNKVGVLDIKVYQDIYEYIKDIKQNQTKINETEAELEKISQIAEQFVKDINSFIAECRLDDIPALNKYESEHFDETLKTIQECFERNLADNRLKTEKENIINRFNKELEKFDYEISEISEEILSELETKLQQSKEQRIIYKQEIETLSQVESLVELKNKKNAELAKLKNKLNNLMTKEIVYNVILKSKEKFNENQPNLVSAEEYLSKITNNKYSKIDFENKNISGTNIKEKDWDNLSRGTKEQLYLALRLGFADNYSKDKDGNSNGLPNLPLIIDDAFVNFDIERTGAVLRCLAEFAKTNQVLFFTCHTKMITEILTTEKIKHHCIEL
ncbi:MAG: hypothetical protein NC200_01340 [Candidatus Gastranaerophilales bacterium]|nr:hypothetical protein [Candidatus Gastranaerophilales bacterium]